MPSSRRTSRSTRSAGDRGTGAFGTLSGLVVLLAFLLLATDVLLELYARSTVSAVAYEAAHSVAVGDDEDEAERQARRALGDVGAGASFVWTVDGDDVVLHVRAERPGALLTALGVRSRTIDRSVTVRREMPR